MRNLLRDAYGDHAIGFTAVTTGETWDYANSTARNAVWPVTQSDATGSASGGFGGTPLSMTIDYGGGIGGGHGFVKFTRTITGIPGAALTVTCTNMTLSRAADEFNDNCGLAVNGTTGHVPTSGLSGPVTVTGTFDSSGEATIVLGHFDLEFGMTAMTLTFDDLTWDAEQGSAPVHEPYRTAFLFEGNTFLGVSRQGLTFEAEADRRNIPWDNKGCDVEQADWDTRTDPIITGRFVQAGRASLFQPGSATMPGDEISERLSARETGLYYAPGQYLTNLRMIAPSLHENGGYLQVRMPRAICLQYAYASLDQSETEVVATFAARVPFDDAAASSHPAKPYVLEVLSAFS